MRDIRKKGPKLKILTDNPVSNISAILGYAKFFLCSEIKSWL